MNKCNCEAHRGDSHFCPLHGEVIHPDHAEALTMSDKPESIWHRKCPADCGADYCNIIEDKQMTDDSTEYIRADLAKPSEWISVETELPVIPEGHFGVCVMCCYYCCEDEPQVVSQVMYDREGHFKESAYGPRGSTWYKVMATHWQPRPSPPDKE